MSHVVKINIKIKDLASLEKAAKNLGLQFNKGKKKFRWYGQWMDDYHGADAAFRDFDPKTFGTCDHTISCPDKGAYEVGVVDNKDGTHSLIWDNWQGGKGLQKYVGPGAKFLVQDYAKEEAKKLMQSKGYSVTEQKTKDGKIQLVCQGY